MTWSIVARDPANGHFGIAVASRFFSVGTLVPNIRPGVGAVATQAFVNPLYGVDGLALLAEGHAPEAVVGILTGRDAGHRQRQVHMIDAHGRNTAFTGEACIDWAGHLVAENVSVAGNMLAGPQVIETTLAVFQAGAGKPLVERFLEAMQAGEDAGGDKRGRQSAAIVVYRDQPYPWLDIRADDHPDPLAELRRLWAVAGERYLHVAETMPTRGNPGGMLDRSEIDRRIADLEAAREAEGRPSASFATPWKP
ncbi:DUF1028 domain-containing protein [Pinisolibacter aquiterrae]|uniref:DUF1028 domain-containing protein n=1 Tax=Pinisolibacter aquiterrae TaxID=2815579 RepID=UPI001C3D1933|nr:DUF1028 domain-containing protein [Pinisolibacter aquiterrae]MBV5262706.1 DUF1028 domain-containing protein [Pinisolibacter aquiterrae]MCC8233526.1 DUF1028 domain-containing protein [Pinisolibacter aquiterrae]